MIPGDGILVIEGFRRRDGLTPESQHLALAFTWARWAVGEARSDQLAGFSFLQTLEELNWKVVAVGSIMLRDNCSKLFLSK